MTDVWPDPEGDDLFRFHAAIDRRHFILASLASGAALLLSCGGGPGTSTKKSSGKRYNLSFGAPSKEGTSQIRGMKMFGDELSKLSNGQFTVTVYPDNQLGDPLKMLQAVQLGSQAMSIGTPSFAASINKKADVLSLLYLAKSEDSLFKGLDGDFGRKLDAYLESSGVKVLAWWAIGSRNFLNNVRPIASPDEVRGLKLRVQSSPVWVKSMQALAANPVAMAFNEVYLAMQQHTIDGFENIFTDIYTYKFYEVCKYLSLTQHLYDVFGVYITKSLWDGFTDDERSMVNQAMKKATNFQRKQQVTDSDDALAQLRQKMQVNDLAPPALQQFRDRVRPLYSQFEGDLGKDWIQEAAKAVG